MQKPSSWSFNSGKKDTPFTARDLIRKMMLIWKGLAPWGLVPLYKGLYVFHFGAAENKRKALYVGLYTSPYGLPRLSKWEPDFNLYTQI